MPTPPTLTQAQKDLAFQRSLELRQARAWLKSYLSGKVGNDLADVIPNGRFIFAWSHGAAQGMRVYTLLRALPYVGHARATALLEQAGIDPKRTVRACGPRQKEKLFELLRDKRPG